MHLSQTEQKTKEAEWEVFSTRKIGETKRGGGDLRKEERRREGERKRESECTEFRGYEMIMED